MQQPAPIQNALDKVDQILARLQQLQSTIAVTRQAVFSDASPNSRALLTSYSGRTKRENAASDGDDRATPNAGAAEWTQWSAPAELVYLAISDILAAAKHAKEVAGGESDVLENPNEGTGDRGLSPIEEERPGPIADKECGTDTGHKTGAITPSKGRDVRGVETTEAKPLGRLKQKPQDSSLKEVPSSRSRGAPSMIATKVKPSQKAWKLSHMKPTKSKGAVMFPNLVYSPSSPPPSSRHFRIMTPFKHTSPKKKAGRALLTGADNAQKAPLLGKKREASPVKSLPALIDRLPSKRRPVSSASATNKSVVSRADELPYPPAHFSRSDRSSKSLTRCDSKKTSSRNRTTPAVEPFKVLEANTITGKSHKEAGHLTRERKAWEHPKSGVGRQQYLKLSSEDRQSGRAKSISPKRKHSDKENLLTVNSSSDLKRSWSAGSAVLRAKTSTGHSMLQRAKGWVMGKQQTKRTLA